MASFYERRRLRVAPTRSLLWRARLQRRRGVLLTTCVFFLCSATTASWRHRRQRRDGVAGGNWGAVAASVATVAAASGGAIFNTGRRNRGQLRCTFSSNSVSGGDSGLGGVGNGLRAEGANGVPGSCLSVEFATK